MVKDGLRPHPCRADRRPTDLKEEKSKAAEAQLDEEKGALWKPIEPEVNTWKPRLNELRSPPKN